MEIVRYVLSGYSYREIGNLIFISERTITNIFNKLTVNNKIELFNLLSRFNMTVTGEPVHTGGIRISR